MTIDPAELEKALVFLPTSWTEPGDRKQGVAGKDGVCGGGVEPEVRAMNPGELYLDEKDDVFRVIRYSEFPTATLENVATGAIVTIPIGDPRLSMNFFRVADLLPPNGLDLLEKLSRECEGLRRRNLEERTTQVLETLKSYENPFEMK